MVEVDVGDSSAPSLLANFFFKCFTFYFILFICTTCSSSLSLFALLARPRCPRCPCSRPHLPCPCRHHPHRPVSNRGSNSSSSRTAERPVAIAAAAATTSAFRLSNKKGVCSFLELPWDLVSVFSLKTLISYNWVWWREGNRG